MNPFQSALDWCIDNPMKMFAACLVVGASVLTALVLVTPTCEEQGGHLESRGVITIPIVVGKGVIMVPRVQYACILPGETR